ncbi:flagellar hook-length control protein FliK [Thioclava sp. DLFJ5-1]|uniref:flagellar hook-length control protein FliK n=1 Tax=Thioclava sp. DLFJ5-1 TaxID=1915314 RepID=UPI0009960E41|nr:flagellar hook-length control protein FliK [Thioclava sp. DLFJ5-1]
MIPFPIPETPKGPSGHLKAAARPTDTAELPGGTFTLEEEAAPKTVATPRGVNSVEEPEGGADPLADKDPQCEAEDAQVALTNESGARELVGSDSGIALPGPQGPFGPTRSAPTVAPDHPTKLDGHKKPVERIVSHDGGATSRLNEKGDQERVSLAHTETDKIETNIPDTASESSMRSVQLSNVMTVQPQIDMQNAGFVKDGTLSILVRNDAAIVAPHDASGRVQRPAETGENSAIVVSSKPVVFVPGIDSTQRAEPASKVPTLTASDAEGTKAGNVETKSTPQENATSSGPLRPDGRSEMALVRGLNAAPSFHSPAATHNPLAGKQPESAPVFGQNSAQTQPTEASAGAARTVAPETDPTLTGMKRRAGDQAAPAFFPLPSTLAEPPSAKTRASKAADVKLGAKEAPQPVEASVVSSRLQQAANANAPQHEFATEASAPPSTVGASGAVARPQPQQNMSPILSVAQSDAPQHEKAGAPERSTRLEAAPLPSGAIPYASPAPALKRMDHARATYLTTAELGATKSNMDAPELTATRAHVGETAETWAAGSAPLITASGGSGQTSAAVPPAPASIAQSIAHQIGISLPRMPDRPVEIALSPEELGHVRMTLHASQNGMTVAIQADRAETLDLMRRHIDTLAREMHDMGYGSLDFQFSQRDERPQQRPDMLDGLGAEPIETPIASAPRVTARLAPPQSGLDLRM